MAASALLFDLDGTLWDSYPWYAKGLAESGVLSENEALARLRSGDSIINLLRQFRISESRLIKRCEELELFPAVNDGLIEIKERGTPVAVVTSLPGRLVKPFLAATGLAPFFKTIIHAGNCPQRKPHPGPLLAALRELSADTVDAFYVGDMPTDAEAAFRAKVSFAWASYGYGSYEPPQPNTVIKSFSDVLQL